MNQVLVRAESISRRFPVRRGLFAKSWVHAVTDVSLEVRRGEAVALVGESGSGKSTIGRLLLGLQPLSGGKVTLDGQDLAQLSSTELRNLRQKMQLVFQDPYSSLDPRRRVGEQITEGMRIFGLGSAEDRRVRACELLEAVGLSEALVDRYPSQFSGGQRQRIAIARALATRPDFIVADEPVSALDVSVQAQVLKILAELRHRLGLAMLFISHDLAVVRHLCDRVVVLYLGRVMEQGTVAEVFGAPKHPYTQALLSATPSFGARREDRLVIAGEPPSPISPPSGCVFRTRCPFATPACAEAPIPQVKVGESHFASCIRLGHDQ